MPTDSLERRVEMLEHTIAGPNGVTAQIAGLRSDTASLRADLAELRREVALKSDLEALRREVALKSDLDALRDELRGEMQTLRVAIDQTNVHMRLLHEEVLERIARLGEALTTSASRPPRTRKKR